MGMLAGKVAIVTGATSGIGEATAEHFVAEGAKVVIAGRRADVGEELTIRLGNAAHFIQTDVAREGDVQAMVEGTIARFNRLDCLVNNAGIVGPIGGIADLDMTQCDAAMNVLLRGVFLGIKAVVPIMVLQGGGSIVNISSVAGTRTGYGPLTYSAAKAAVIHLTSCVSTELGEKNIRVNCISPGAIITGIFGKAFAVADDVADRTASILEENFTKFQPIQRAGKPIDIARAAAWLASDLSGFVNGHNLS
jgi:NAD(P)-dependent dehydrogenase (short-subunit alcohol dehydrogenase family)